MRKLAIVRQLSKGYKSVGQQRGGVGGSMPFRVERDIKPDVW